MINLERLLEKSIPEPNSGCWLWTGALSGGRNTQLRYGKIQVNKRFIPAHRASWIAHNGRNPGELLVCHSCDTPSCINPDHLFLGTHTVNMHDMFRKGRRRIRRGEAHHAARLTDEQVKAILNDGRRGRAIAAELGVTEQTVSYIRRGHTWKHLSRGEIR